MAGEGGWFIDKWIPVIVALLIPWLLVQKNVQNNTDVGTLDDLGVRWQQRTG